MARSAARFLALVLFLPSLLLSAPSAQADDVRIGVLAMRGEERTLEHWQPTADYLGRALPQHRFSIVPLDFDEVHVAVRQRRVDFVLANSAYYVELEMLYRAAPVVTLRNRVDAEHATSAFGGVVFTRADRRDVRTLEDLRGKHFAAVSRGSFGGWQAGWRELMRQGIDPEHDFEALDFVGTHDAVVLAVRDGRADAGTARTGTLEAMASEGSIDLADFHVLAERRLDDFPFRLSTALYPEWPLARLAGVPESLAVDVAVALLQMPPDTPAAAAGGGTGWSLPLNYQAVHDALKELRVGPYEHLRHPSAAEVLEEYGHVVGLALLLVLLALSASVHFGNLNRRLRTQQAELERLNTSLEDRVAERTERVEALLLREQHLRGIVETVAEVNQIIITTGSPEEMLKASCDRIIAHRDYRFAWVVLDRGGKLETTVHSYGSREHIRRFLDAPQTGPAAQSMQDNRTVLIDAAPLPGLAGATALIALPLRPDAFSPPFGALCVLTVRDSRFDAEETGMLEQLAGDLGFALHAYERRAEAARLQQERIDNYEETILSLVDMIEKRDTYTAGHTRRVARYCELIGARMGLDADDLSRLTHAATLHDIGKIVIPDAVLLKPGRLTPLEYELIKQHVTAGYDTLAGVEMYRALAEIMRHHHERLDGSGYPAGLRGDAVPLLSRIMAVADAFDAMTSNRIYKPRKPVAEALAELKSLAGKDYDPQVVEAAVCALAEVEPPATEDQVPKTPLDRQRFAYFFNDQLTGAYNRVYLEFILRNAVPEVHAHASLVMLHRFSAYNAAHGWVRGDRLLHDFAAWLMGACPNALVFRVMGDDFLVMGPTEIGLDEQRIHAESPLGEGQVQVEVRTIDVATTGVDELCAMTGTKRDGSVRAVSTAPVKGC